MAFFIYYLFVISITQIPFETSVQRHVRALICSMKHHKQLGS
jgi:hypothetical protein